MAATLPDIYDHAVREAGLRPDPAQREAVQKLEPLRDWLEREAMRPRPLLRRLFARPEPPPMGGLYLWGGVGRGKSMLMDMFHGAVAIEAKRRVHFHAFMQEVHAGLNAARKREAEDALAPVGAALARDLRLLCLDEMQISDITDAMVVGRLFEMLFDAGVVVVTTSNRPPDDLYKDGLNRALFLPFIDLIKERLEVYELAAAGDYRQDRLHGERVYFHPADAKAHAAVERIWTDLSAGADVKPLRLTVQGREVVIDRFADGVARAGFWELCGRALGAADYLALAQAVRVLVLDDIPQLSRRNFNEARRFVTLVDALYEARVQLVASAAAEPERLYIEGAGAFEFERTASRLREMQSDEWARQDSSRQE